MFRVYSGTAHVWGKCFPTETPVLRLTPCPCGITRRSVGSNPKLPEVGPHSRPTTVEVSWASEERSEMCEVTRRDGKDAEQLGNRNGEAQPRKQNESRGRAGENGMLVRGSAGVTSADSQKHQTASHDKSHDKTGCQIGRPGVDDAKQRRNVVHKSCPPRPLSVQALPCPST